MKRKFFLLNCFLLMLFIGASKATNSQSILLLEDNNQQTFIPNESAPQAPKLTALKKLKLIALLQNATTENKKVTAAILTLTLGMLGVHRIYLGTAPYIPAVYLFTFGGGFFILPLIDLVMILTTNDISKFENNNRLLMWTGE